MAPTVVSLLDLDPELGDGLAAHEWSAARAAARVHLSTLPPGRWRASADGSAVFVGAGMLVRELRLGDRIASELVGAGDLLDTGGTPDRLLPLIVDWHVVDATDIAVLGPATLQTLPSVVSHNLIRRAAQRASRLAAAHAIAQLPRVEDRVLALFGLLAERWGRVTPHGVVVLLELTHETIGTLVGAARPTVSLALKELAASGEVQRAAGGWRVSAEALVRLQPGLDAAHPLPRVRLAEAAPEPPVPGAPAQELDPDERPGDLAALRARVDTLRTRREAPAGRRLAARPREPGGPPDRPSAASGPASA